MMDKFLSCDWGTSAFRLRLIRTSDLGVIAEERDDRGIAVTYQLWTQQQDQTVSRKAFYATALKERLYTLDQKLGFSLRGVPIVLSGMASSYIGLMEIPYKESPFNVDGSDLTVEILNDAIDGHQLIIISGVRTDQDVMRGEETKVVGCSSVLGDTDTDRLLIFPGTHSKHVIIEGNNVINFKTFMTGEYFKLLSTGSVISASVTAGGDFSNPVNQLWFDNGVEASQTAGLLHTAFMVRTNELLKGINKQQNFFYLSGLLIGAELQEMQANSAVYLIGDTMHRTLYARALDALGVAIARAIDADFALIRGQYVMLSKLYQNEIGPDSE